MISLTNVPPHTPDLPCTFSDLINQTKRIFEIVRQRRTMLIRYTNTDSLAILKQQHGELIREEDEMIGRYATVQQGAWGTLRSFFIRFRFRLAEMEQRHSNSTGKGASNQFMSGLDELIQELLQSHPANLGKFLTYIFEHYRHLISARIRSLSPITLPTPITAISSSLSPMISSILPQRRPSLYRVLSCNDMLLQTWMREGRINYSPLDIDPSLREIYFFSRDQSENAELMYEEMMERNREIQECIKGYKWRYVKYQKWRRLRNSQSERTRKRESLLQTKKRDTQSKVLSPNRNNISRAQTRNIEIDHTSKPRIPDTNQNKRLFARTMFRIRPSLQQKRTQMSEPLQQFKQTALNLTAGNQTTVNTTAYNISTPLRKFKRPATIKIQFKKVMQHYI